MYHWRKFNLFTENITRIQDEIQGEIQCCSSGRGTVVLGTDDGFVSLLDREFQLLHSFPAHSSSVRFVHQLEQRNLLLTVGEGEESGTCLKVFDLDKKDKCSNSSPECLQSLPIFTSQFPEAKIASFSVFEEDRSGPSVSIALGLNNGCIYCIQGDTVLQKIKRLKVEVDKAHSDEKCLAITGLGFRSDGQLFAVTPSTVSLFNLQTKEPTRETLDDVIGSETGTVAMSESSELIIGRPEAVYFYRDDVGRGPCWAFADRNPTLPKARTNREE